MEEKKKFADLKVGDTIWCTDPKWRAQDPDRPLMKMIVNKVGRKYVTTNRVDEERSWTSDYEFDMTSGYEKGEGNYKKHLVRSPEAYYEEKARRKVFDKFKHHFSGWGNHLHDEVKTEDIIMAAQLLRIDLELGKE